MRATAANVEVDVTPIFGNGAVCEIEPGNGPSHAYVKGGVIRLHGNSDFKLTFQLPQATPTNPPPYQFDRAEPIWSAQAGCPGSACRDSQISNPQVDVTGTKLTVDVNQSGTPNAVHVSLGFSNGVRCDPVIINT